MPDKTVDWYFDFISPFAYLQHYTLIHDYPDIQLNYYPVLFGALLRANGHKGPAEIPAKRIMTYRYCHWLAEQRSIPFRFPAVHPYKPMQLLRLAIAANCTPESIIEIFRFLWQRGSDPTDANALAKLAQSIGVEELDTACQQSHVKDTLRSNTDRALQKGIFGVPTLVIGDELFWGEDLTELAMAFRKNQALFQTEEYRRLESLPNGLEL